MNDFHTSDALGEDLSGRVILPGDAGYDEARAVWNGRFGGHPDVIVRPAGRKDVVAAVDMARRRDLPVGPAIPPSRAGC
jgi:FAD/FMN-containing dehydrogenase